MGIKIERIVEGLERVAHFAAQGGPKGYMSESADLALYLIQNSTTPDRFKSTDEFAIPGQMKSVGGLAFDFSSQDDFYKLVAKFYASRPNRQGVTAKKISNFMELHKYHFKAEDGKLNVSDVDNLTGMLANCL